MLLRQLLIALVLLLMPSVAFSGEKRPIVDEIVITPSTSHLLVHGAVRDCCSDEMLQALHRGMPLNFTFQIELNRVREWWANRSIVSLSILHTLNYDSLTQHYQITLQERDNQRITTPSLADALKIMRELRGIKLAPVTAMEPERNYVLRIKAILAEKTLPLGLHYVVPLISLANVETDWRQVEFRY